MIIVIILIHHNHQACAKPKGNIPTPRARQAAGRRDSPRDHIRKWHRVLIFCGIISFVYFILRSLEMANIINPPGVLIDSINEAVKMLGSNKKLLIGIEGNILGDIYYYIHSVGYDIEGMSLHGVSGLGMGYGLTRSCRIFSKDIKLAIEKINVKGSLIEGRIKYYLDAISGFRVDVRSALISRLMIDSMDNNDGRLILSYKGFRNAGGSRGSDSNVKFVKELGCVDILIQDMRDIDDKVLDRIESSFSWLSSSSLGIGSCNTRNRTRNRTSSYRSRIVLSSKYDIDIYYNL